MVMETPPSPQCVGREFVRQYYTLLHEAPAHLHRFYNNSSSFIHGGLDPPNRETTIVVGQKQIHQKIQQLNFRDCHAKISQVDSQATLGNGVVVQVTGELSNGGQPMRRFTQTFVLAFQAPKKYYVHNDIFRYQDMLTEEEYEEISRNEIDEDQVIQHQNTLLNKTSQVAEEEKDWTAQPMVNGMSDAHHHEPPPAEIPPPQPVAQPIHQAPPSQPVLQPLSPVQTQPSLTEPIIPSSTSPLIVQPNQVIRPVHSPQIDVNQMRPELSQPEVTSPTSHLRHHSMIDQDDSLYNQAEPEPTPPSPQNSPGDSGVVEVKTYANLVKGSSGSTASTMYYTPPPPPQSVSPTAGLGRVDRPKPPREARVFGTNDVNVNINNDSGSFDMDRGRKPVYSDSQQVFMGNLPQNVTETELRDIFGKFGTILDMRILSKAGNKPGGRTPPKYGFVIFEQPSSVQSVLNAKHIIYPGDGGIKLNVEEKKRSGAGSGGPIGGRGGGRSGGGRASIGSGGAPRGPSRPGPPPSALPQRQNFHRR